LVRKDTERGGGHFEKAVRQGNGACTPHKRGGGEQRRNTKRILIKIILSQEHERGQATTSSMDWSFNVVWPRPQKVGRKRGTRGGKKGVLTIFTTESGLDDRRKNQTSMGRRKNEKKLICQGSKGYGGESKRKRKWGVATEKDQKQIPDCLLTFHHNMGGGKKKRVRGGRGAKEKKSRKKGRTGDIKWDFKFWW